MTPNVLNNSMALGGGPQTLPDGWDSTVANALHTPLYLTMPAYDAVNDVFFIFGGYGTSSQQILQRIPRSLTGTGWKMASRGFSGQGGCAHVHGDYLYTLLGAGGVGGGPYGSSTNMRYHIYNDTWHQDVTASTQVQTNFSYALIDGEMNMAYGHVGSPSTFYCAHQKYNFDTDTWTQKTAPPGSGNNATKPFLNSAANAYDPTGQEIWHAVGGHAPSLTPVDYGIWNQTTGLWTRTTNYPGVTNISGGSACYYNGYIYFTFGTGYNTNLHVYRMSNSTWYYYANYFTTNGAIPGRQYAPGIIVGTDWFIFGGYNGSPMSDIVKIDLTTLPTP